MGKGDWKCEEAEGDDRRLSENDTDNETDAEPEQECTRHGGSVLLMHVFIIFMILCAFCILNMLVGILCQVVDATAKEEEENACLQSFRDIIIDAFYKFDISGDEQVTVCEFQKMKHEDSVRNCFIALGIEEDQLDERLDQIQDSLFAPHDDELARDEHTGILRTTKSFACIQANAVESERETLKALQLDEFIEKVLQVRPTVAASYLDMESMRVRASRAEARFNYQLNGIEEMLLTLKGSTASASVPMGQTDSGLYRFVGGGDESCEVATRGGSNQATNRWLRNLSSEVLFAELRNRATRQPTSREAD
jgi:hypothetical protein